MLGYVERADHQDGDHILQVWVVERMSKIRTCSQNNIEDDRGQKSGQHWCPERTEQKSNHFRGDHECSDWKLVLQGADGTKEGLPLRGRVHAKAEMNECALWPRNGTGMMYVKGRGGRTGSKVQLSVQLGSGGNFEGSED